MNVIFGYLNLVFSTSRKSVITKLVVKLYERATVSQQLKRGLIVLHSLIVFKRISYATTSVKPSEGYLIYICMS